MEIIPFRIKASEEEDNFSEVYSFLIKGSHKDAYEVEIDIDNLNDLGITDTRCTCPHYTFRELECKHIKKAIEILTEFGIKTECINKANHTQTLNNMTIDTGGKEQSPCSTDKSGNGTDNVQIAKGDKE